MVDGRAWSDMTYHFFDIKDMTVPVEIKDENDRKIYQDIFDAGYWVEESHYKDEDFLKKKVNNHIVKYIPRTDEGKPETKNT